MTSTIGRSNGKRQNSRHSILSSGNGLAQSLGGVSHDKFKMDLVPFLIKIYTRYTYISFSH